MLPLDGKHNSLQHYLMVYQVDFLYPRLDGLLLTEDILYQHIIALRLDQPDVLEDNFLLIA